MARDRISRVELEGCHRVNVDMDNQLRTLHPTVVARLLG